MLQGNPFETEKWVEERTKIVQGGVERRRQPWTTQGSQTLHRERLPWTDQGHWKVRGWLLPAALVLSTLLIFIIGR